MEGIVSLFLQVLRDPASGTVVSLLSLVIAVWLGCRSDQEQRIMQGKSKKQKRTRRRKKRV
jgi:hypothetical protein